MYFQAVNYLFGNWCMYANVCTNSLAKRVWNKLQKIPFRYKCCLDKFKRNLA